jgi:hypothetical protein
MIAFEVVEGHRQIAGARLPDRCVIVTSTDILFSGGALKEP